MNRGHTRSFQFEGFSSTMRIHRLSAKSRGELAAKMTPDQIAEAQRLAREWKPK